MSRAAAKLDEGVKAWRERPWGEVPYLFLDARYENEVAAKAHVSEANVKPRSGGRSQKVRMGGRIADFAISIAVGIDATGKRRVLGCTVVTS